MSEDELAKLRKKLKGPALKDLRVLTCQALVPLKDLQKPGSRRSIIRAQVKQIGDFTSDEECNEYKLTNTYLKIELEALNNQFFTPEVKELFPRVVNLSDRLQPPKVSHKISAEKNFQMSLSRSLVTVCHDYKDSAKIDPKELEPNEKLSLHQKT